MINLLPPQAHKQVKREYWIRVASVWACLLSGVFVVVTLLLVPTYVLLNIEVDALEIQSVEESDTDEAYNNAEEQVISANAIAKQLNVPRPRTSITEILTTIEGVVSEGVELRTYAIEREERSINTLQIQGTAASREALATFKAALEREALFESAEIPISDLARDENLPFVLTLAIAGIRREP